MTGAGRSVAVALMAAGALWLLAGAEGERAFAQTAGEKKEGEQAPAVIIQREVLRLIDPKTYQVPLQLVPVRTVELAAPVDALVGNVHSKPGQKVEPQSEIVRLDNSEQQLELERARANHRAAQIELRVATARNSADQTDLAEARLQAAKAELDLASLRLERTSVRAPFAGEVFRVHVIAGQMVRRGDPLASVGDTTKLIAEIPVDRHQVEPGKTIEIRVEGQTVPVKVESVLPLAERFEPLRELVDSAATAVVVLENTRREFQAGQTVYVPIIPRHWLAEVPTSAVANTSDGERRVQVVRGEVVRDVRVQLLGQIGAERMWVSGPFAETDELVVSSSQELPDGTRIRPRGAGERPADSPGETPARPPAAGRTPAPF